MFLTFVVSQSAIYMSFNHKNYTTFLYPIIGVTIVIILQKGIKLLPIYVSPSLQAMEEDFHPSYDCSDCAKKAAEDVPENGNAKKKPKMFLVVKVLLGPA